MDEIDAVVAAYDFTTFESIVVLAGGRGELLHRILAVSPESTGVLFEDESLMEPAADYLDAAGVLHRCTLQCGSLTDTVPVGGDLYVLCRSADAAALRSIRRSIPDHGRLLLIGSQGLTDLPGFEITREIPTVSVIEAKPV